MHFLFEIVVFLVWVQIETIIISVLFIMVMVKVDLLLVVWEGEGKHHKQVFLSFACGMVLGSHILQGICAHTEKVG